MSSTMQNVSSRVGGGFIYWRVVSPTQVTKDDAIRIQNGTKLVAGYGFYQFHTMYAGGLHIAQWTCQESCE